MTHDQLTATEQANADLDVDRLTPEEEEEFDRLANEAIARHGTSMAPPIVGYRTLDKDEVDIVNRIKALGTQIEALVVEVDAHVREQADGARNDPDGRSALIERSRLRRAQPQMWIGRACEDLQSGLMKLTRAVTQPSTFA